jgi:hypothetical protein
VALHCGPAQDFAIEVEFEKPKKAAFHKLKIFTPQNQKMFDVAWQAKIIKLESDIPKKFHKIKNGESLSVIADKYNVSVKSIKAANGLKNNNIRAGKSLQIPVQSNGKKGCTTF